MGNSQECNPRTDWVGDTRSFVLAWGIPTVAVIGSAFLEPSFRTAIWVIALIWMGAACTWNARQCGRTHCRFTGPFLLIMALPVFLNGLGLVSFGPFGWWGLGLTILVGSVVLWWGSETLWGKFWLPGT
jgi:hypothetical protein